MLDTFKSFPEKKKAVKNLHFRKPSTINFQFKIKFRKHFLVVKLTLV